MKNEYSLKMIERKTGVFDVIIIKWSNHEGMIVTKAWHKPIKEALKSFKEIKELYKIDYENCEYLVECNEEY